MGGLGRGGQASVPGVGKDSGQKLIEASHRRATGPCYLLGLGQRAVHDPHTAHPTDVTGGGMFTKPLALVPA